MNVEVCLIVDFGSQYTQLIARKLREIGVFSKVVPPNEKFKEELASDQVKAVILSGGPSSVSDKDAPRLPCKIVEIKKPVLGICYGMQSIAAEFGGRVGSGDAREYGVEKIKTQESTLFDSNEELDVLLSHGDHVDQLPEAFQEVARTHNGVIAAFESPREKIFGLQFHPEVHHTVGGKEILKNFLSSAGFEFRWQAQHMFDSIKEDLEAQYKGGKILCALSGGVDSTVLAVLLNKIFPEKVHCFCVDTGVMRKNEIKQLKDLFERTFHFPIEIVDAQKEFLSALAGVTDPEQKRKIIGKTFIDVFRRQQESLSGMEYLAQGTLYPDVIESKSAHGGPSAKIKSHHNVGGLPKDIPFKLMEPFALLFKDEVRRIGEFLGIPHDFVWRHPFPGPGLAVRILGEVTEQRVATLQEADWRLQEVLRAYDWYEKLWQSFCVYLPVKSVGVMGDGRTYEETIAVRCVHSEDGMTAHIAALPVEVLEKISSKIINEVSGINRVVYDISSKPPSTIEWE
jgi:GMP synthase (glutamine-hydrolysing)